jgi:hypothetical protein
MSKEKHDNELPEIIQLTGAAYYRLAVYGTNGGKSVLDLRIGSDGSVSLLNLINNYIVTVKPS